MKKLLATIVAMLIACTLLAGCQTLDNHSHTPQTEWSSDGTITTTNAPLTVAWSSWILRPVLVAMQLAPSEPSAKNVQTPTERHLAIATLNSGPKMRKPTGTNVFVATKLTCLHTTGRLGISPQFLVALQLVNKATFALVEQQNKRIFLQLGTVIHTL